MTNAQNEDAIADSLWHEVGVRFNGAYEYEYILVLLEELKNIYDQPEELEDNLSCILYQGFSNSRLGNWDGLKKYLDEFLLKSSKLSKENKKSIYFADFHYLSGLYLFQQGNYSSAASHYEKTLELIKNREDEFSFSVTDVYHNLAIVMRMNGDYEKAISYFKYSLIGVEDKVEKAIKMGNLISCNIELKKFDNVEKGLLLVRKEMLNQKKDNLYWSTLYSNSYYLGKFYNRTGAPKKALKYLNGIEKFKIDPAQQIAVDYERVMSQYLLGNSRGIDNLLNQKISKAEQELIYRHPILATIQNQLAVFAIENKDYDKALRFINKSANILGAENSEKVVQSNPIYFSSLTIESDIYDKMQDSAAALASLIKAGKVLDELVLQSLDSDLSKYFWINKAKALHEQIIERYLSANDLAGAWQHIQKGKGILLTQALNQLQQAETNEALVALEKRRRNLSMDINFLEAQPSGDAASANEQERLQQIIRLNEQRDSLSDVIDSDFPGYSKWSEQRHPLSLADARLRLPSKNALLLDMFVGQDNIYLFGLTNKNQFLETIPYSESLKKQLLEFQNLLSKLDLSKASFDNYCTLGNSLYSSIFNKIITGTKEQIDNIIFVPDEEFNYLPIGALLTQPFTSENTGVRYDQLSYLAKEFNISYEYATELLGGIKKRQKEKYEDVLVGFAPTFSGSNSPARNLDSLLYTMTEVQIINKIIGGKINLAQTATKANFLKDIKNYSIAHLATHAVCNDSLPFNSNIKFYQDSLSLFEIVNIPNRLELIVLSACETGTGILRKGEGISSLARGFINSGCPSIVTTLWKVNDKQTAQLMEHFYLNLQAGNEKHKSLSEAQREYLNTTQAASFSHPYYWAAFIQIGNTDPIKFGTIPWWQYLIIGAIIFLLITWLLKRNAQQSPSP